MFYFLQKKQNVYHHNCFTNQILYADLIFPLPNISSEQSGYLSLFCDFLTEVGVKDRSYVENLDFLNAYTGGVDSYLSLNISTQNPDVFAPVLGIRGKALYRNTEKFFTALKDIISSVNFQDPKRILELFTKLHISLENNLIRNAMRYASSLALSSVSPSSYLYDQWYGFEFFQMVRKLAENPEKAVSFLIELFEEWKKTILKGADLVIGCDQEHYDSLKKQNFYHLCDLSPTSEKWNCDLSLKKESSHGRLISSPVAFTTKAFRTIGYSDPLSAALLISTQLLQNKILHQHIREMGGAYGSGANYSPSAGTFYFYSFRDPNLANTIKAFHVSIEHLLSKGFDDEDLWDAKLGILQDMDGPICPSSRAITSYIWEKTGKTKEIRKNFRSKVLNATKEEIHQAAERHLKPHIEQAVLVSFSDKNFFDKENVSLETPLPLKSV